MMSASTALREPLPVAVQKGAEKSPRPQVPGLNCYVAILSVASVLALVTASECHSITYLPSLQYGAVLWGWWGCVACAMWRLERATPFSTRAIALHTALGSALGALHLVLLASPLAGWPIHDTALTLRSKQQELFNVNRFGLEILIYGFIFGIVGLIRNQVQAQRNALSASELQRQLSAAHLQALQMQLEPHFLFNTLNAITTLVETRRHKEATEMLNHLNCILKSTLKRTTPEKVPLSQELEIVDSYLAIEQVRFPDRLRIEMVIDPNTLDGLVPCFLLQPIVENAIRHGIAHCEDAGLVEACARREGDWLHLRIRDTGRGNVLDLNPPDQDGHGIGLKNTRARLTHFYRNDYAMEAQPLAAGGFEVTIAVPYERG